MARSLHSEFYQKHVTPDNLWEKIECLHPDNYTREFFPSQERYEWLMGKLDQLNHDDFQHRYWGRIDGYPVYIERVGWLMVTRFDVCWLEGKF